MCIWHQSFHWHTTTDQCWPGVLKLPINEVSVTEGPLCSNLEKNCCFTLICAIMLFMIIGAFEKRVV